MSAAHRIAVVPARGGSKGLARKNLAELAGRPLIAHTLEAALGSGLFDRVVVSSEDDEILDVARAEGAEALRRPGELASDDASSLDVLAHALESCAAPGSDYALLQPTSPLRSALHIASAVEMLEASDGTSLVSVTASEHPPHKAFVIDEKGEARPLFDWASLSAPRQGLPITLRQNGAIYLGRSDLFLATRNLFAPRLLLFEMAPDVSVDVDAALDLRLVELLLAEQR